MVYFGKNKPKIVWAAIYVLLEKFTINPQYLLNYFSPHKKTPRTLQEGCGTLEQFEGGGSVTPRSPCVPVKYCDIIYVKNWENMESLLNPKGTKMRNVPSATS